ncbi:MAG TPA: cytochrome C oxidase subunit IV family protein [Verrucomicrobiae bacterium]|nr:cytochrome C oxidase subunit IV family protein [Verrucomicrobiae bacterium]
MASPIHSPAATPPTTAHAHDAHDVKKDVKKYLIVFAALLVGTILTVGMYYVHIPSLVITITVALFIATVKAALVAGFFMHLISERKAIYSVLLATAFFFAAMMYLILWHRADIPSKSNWWEGNITKKEGPRNAIR